MDLPSTELIEVLNYLLPGFLTAGVLFVLTPATRPAPFERVVQALIFTLIVRVGVQAASDVASSFGLSALTLKFWITDGALATSVVLALLLGVGLAWVTNHDKLHWLLRQLRITSQTS